MRRTRPNLVAIGAGLLALSLLVTVLEPTTFAPQDRGPVFAAWVAHASFWLGMLAVAAQLLRLVLAERAPADVA